MSEEEKLPEETPVEAEDTPDTPAEDAPDEPADGPEEPAREPDSPESEPEPEPEARAIASAEDQPHDPTQETRACTVPEESTPSREKGRRPRIAHVLWRGWWLAVCILGIAVLLGRIDAPGADWVRQPMRAFGGAIAAGGVLASLPGLIRRDLPERPRLRRCLLGLFTGLIWGVLG